MGPEVRKFLFDGHLDVFQRSSIVALHPGGTAEIQKVIMARRPGIGRQVREQAGWRRRAILH